ncbi:hypothetical protein [Pseudobacteroides cellulosolvens]|uniref:Uncharacterized protein n=1 Tax=Pseudobacteroides cellulosolvens ATCC 35603 = DSM 2933 TaxID=398512 RepID=A0A0L6JXB3_9FIRM|nr:hypothetical protein [Pseudobacteroides cellulosolvens]KNY30491.1 hypothetical protein Bccel_5771 [Pseudobacteroides cellulosolvens ATCC 35603 = DSM 2933]KNY30498.1 hypothetical protein Bccel_5778 [Pseudobacteroides cellulosolvens ATCC 35603 = DSM 2933]
MSSIKLSGSAGTGNTILNNWQLFKFKHNKTTLTEDGYIYNFDVEFNNHKGYMVIVVSNGQVDESTTIDCEFDRPLGAYNDTPKFDDGLYVVAEKMLKVLLLKPFDVDN